MEHVWVKKCMHNASINVKPEGGGTLGICGVFDLYCLPQPRESGPQGGDVCFFCAEQWDQVTSSHVLVCALAILEVPVWRLKAFQSGLVPPANNLYRIDGHGALSCIGQHVRLFVSD